MAKEKALELDTEAAGYSGGEAVHFGGFPGMWAPGVPIALTALGFETAQDARDAVKALELPLKEVSVDAGSAPMPARPNHAVEIDDDALPESELEPAKLEPASDDAPAKGDD